MEQAGLQRVSSPVLVGRRDELAALTAAATHPPAVATVEGEAGVGKTRLVRALIDSPDITGRRLLIGGCSPVREPFPLGPVVGALGSIADRMPAVLRVGAVAGALRSLVPEIAHRLPPAPDALEDAAAEQHRLFRAVREVLAALSPAILVLEDLHWSDPSSVELVSFLLSDPVPDLSIVLTYRREDVAADDNLLRVTSRADPRVSSVRVSLRPLDVYGITELTRAILDADDVSSQFAQFLYERTSGVPFAVEEMLRLLLERGYVTRRRGRWERRPVEQIQVPDAVRDSVLERMYRLPEDARVLVQAAAVVGEPGENRLLYTIARLPRPRGAGALSRAVSSGLMQATEDGLYGLRHELARQAVYEDIPPPARAELHGRAAQMLERESPQPVAQLAIHYKQARNPAKWARYAGAAADVATARFDDSAACRFLQDALNAPGIPRRTRVGLAVKLGEAALQGLAHHDAVALLQQMLVDDSLTPSARGRLRLSLGLLIAQDGDASRGLAEVEAAVPDLVRSDAAASVRAMLNLSTPWVVERHVDDHLYWLQRALKSAERIDDAGLELMVTADHAATLLYVGDPSGWDVADRLDRPQASAAHERQRMRGLLNVAGAAIHLGYYDRARSYLQRCRRIGQRTDYPRLQGGIDVCELLIDHATGRWGSLQHRAAEVAADVANVPQAHVDALVVQALMMRSRGDVAAAAESLMEVAKASLRAGCIPISGMAAAGLARAHIDQAASSQAPDVIARVAGVIALKGTWAWAADATVAQVEMLLWRGDRAGARSTVDALAAGLRGKDAPAARAALATARSLLAAADKKLEEAADMASDAEAMWRALPRPYEAATCKERWGLWTIQRDRDHGAELLKEALDEFSELGATVDSGRVRRHLRDHNIVVAHRRGRKSYGNRLSPREAEVARLAALGRTNRQIAETLFLSVRTVERHIYNAMRKTGAASRDLLGRQTPADGDGRTREPSRG